MKECSVQETAEILKNTDSLVLTAHTNSDGDALGSLLSLGAGLEQLGKSVHLLIDDELPPQFSFLPGIEKIRRPDKDNIIKADLLVILDASDFERIGKAAEFSQVKSVLNIDHHVSNTGASDFRLLDVDAAATCELVFAVLEELAVKIDKNMAAQLYTGIVTDCGFFRYANTTPKTMRVAASLLDTGLESNAIADHLETRTAENLRMLPKILDTLEFFAQGKIAAITISRDLYNSNMDSDAYIKYPRYIEGVEIAVLFKGITEDLTRVSMRSKTLDVSKAALAFDGGGHIRAAGCSIYHDIPKAKEIIISALTGYLE